MHALEPSVLGFGFQVCIAWSSFGFLYRDGAVDNLAELEHASEDFGIYIVEVWMLVGPSNTSEVGLPNVPLVRITVDSGFEI